MKRLASTLAVLIAVGFLSACADYTTTGEPQDDQGQPVVEETAPTLAGTSWQLQAAEGGAVADASGSPITLTFDESTLSGQAAVNTYHAEYHAEEGGALEIGPIASTKMAGSEEAMKAETAYFAALAEVDGFSMDAAELHLTSHGTTTLAFEAAGATPGGSASGDPLEAEAAKNQPVADSVVGMTEEEAEATVTDAGLVFRVVSVDGQPNLGTADYRTDRVNVEIVDGKVTEATIG